MPTDPLAPIDAFSRDDILSMTHQPEAPNPVPGIVKPAMDYLTSGDMMPAHKPGTQPKDYLRELLQHPDIMAKNIEQASNFAGMAGTLKGGMGAPLKAPEAAPRYIITSPDGKSYVLKHSLSEQLQELGGDWHSRPVIDAQGNVIHNPINSQHVSGPILRLNEDGTLTKGILAHHGSPHDFDKFDLSKIGTGEGAQAYGHGLYFAENENVAKEYKRDVTAKGLGGIEESYAFYAMQRNNGDRTAAIQDLRRGAQSYFDRMAGNRLAGGWKIMGDELNRSAEMLEKGWTPPKGHMYQVAINADPEHFLDWDRPLSEQSPQVIDALNKAGIKLKHTITDDHIQSLRDQGRNGEADFLEGQRTYIERNSEQTGQNALVNLARQMKEGAQEYDYPSASDALRQAGIPGIKYLDQGSRMTGGVNKLGDNWFVKGSMTPYKTEAEAIAAAEAAGGRTSNYVVFDDKLIDILKKYGWAGLGLPAMGAAVRGDQQ